MRFKLQKTPNRKLKDVIVGAARDIRWHDVKEDTINATRRHETQQRVLRYEAVEKVRKALKRGSK